MLTFKNNGVSGPEYSQLDVYLLSDGGLGVSIPQANRSVELTLDQVHRLRDELLRVYGGGGPAKSHGEL